MTVLHEKNIRGMWRRRSLGLSRIQRRTVHGVRLFISVLSLEKEHEARACEMEVTEVRGAPDVPQPSHLGCWYNVGPAIHPRFCCGRLMVFAPKQAVHCYVIFIMYIFK